jgi:hypothetical protein
MTHHTGAPVAELQILRRAKKSLVFDHRDKDRVFALNAPVPP